MSGFTNDPRLMAIPNQEFNMYMYHLQQINENTYYRLVRNMCYCLTHVDVRNDPVYYILMLVLLLERNLNYISFPYYLKGVVPMTTQCSNTLATCSSCLWYLADATD